MGVCSPLSMNVPYRQQWRERPCSYRVPSVPTVPSIHITTHTQYSMNFLANYSVPTSTEGTREHVNTRQLRKDLRDFCAVSKTRGVYGLVDPSTKVIRYVGSSDHIEKRYGQHVDRKASNTLRAKNYWVGDLLSEGYLPVLVVLEEVGPERNLITVERGWIESVEFVGGADLNWSMTSKVLRP